MTTPIDAPQTKPAPQPAAAAVASSTKSGGFSFHDLWETVNPLQHIPLIAPLYREITGDTITPAARIAGDSLYGGIFGAVGGIVDSLVEGETGKDIGGHVMATLFGDDDAKPAVVTAEADTASAQSGMPTSLLPPDASASAGSVVPGVAVPAATKPIAAPAGPTPFFMSLQKGGHASHGKPLSTSVPLPDTKPASSIPGIGKPTAALPAASGPQSPAQAAAPGAQPTFVNPLTDTTNSSDMSGLTSNAINPALASGTPSGMPAQMMKALDQYAKLQKERTATAVGQTDMLVN